MRGVQRGVLLNGCQAVLHSVAKIGRVVVALEHRLDGGEEIENILMVVLVVCGFG